VTPGTPVGLVAPGLLLPPRWSAWPGSAAGKSAFAWGCAGLEALWRGATPAAGTHKKRRHSCPQGEGDAFVFL